ncbi:hypothetical protein PC122_g14683 [Phytophthora cactorum]|nr:hypothetical protein PC122_g14683 [Phytophthora cactorum]
MIVLSGAEKYARAQAQFEPVVEKLSGLSTVAFHQEMNKWKSVIECDELLNDKKKTRRGDYWSRSTQLLSEQIEAVLRTQGKNEVLY